MNICSFESYYALKMENIDDILIKVLMSCCRVSLKPGESWTPRPTVNGIADTTSLSDKSQIHRFPEQQDRHLIELCNIEKKKKTEGEKKSSRQTSKRAR